MSKTMKRIAVLLITTLIAPAIVSFIPSVKSLTVAEVKAAEAKSKLIKTSATIGIQSSPEYISIENYNENAKYTFSSADKKIATVNEYGMVRGIAKGKTKIKVTETLGGEKKEIGTLSVNVVNAKIDPKEVEIGLNGYGYVPIAYINYEAKYSLKSADSKIVAINEYGTLEGKKLGKTTVSVTETYKGKTRKLGSCTIKVINSRLATKQTEIPVAGTTYCDLLVDCINSKATYTCKSSDKSIVSVDEYGNIFGLKEGTADVTISETYNKKTRKLGTVKVKVVGSSIEAEYSNIELGVNSSTSLTDIVYIKNYIWEAYYSCESEDESIVKVEEVESDWGSKYTNLIGKALGSTKLTIYENYNGTKRKVGTVTVTVKDFPVTGLELYTYDFLEVDGKYTRKYYLGEDYKSDSLRYYINLSPYNATTPVTYETSDETIVKVDETGVVTPVKEGKATITITCGSYSVSFVAEITTYSDTLDEADW
ncbi:Ig-like domain-containing protein [Lachnospiraceae bacterium MD1]|jgi:uncharacterized protein YjdB|uniref:Ig-like domain-containing protein n=1 Tax=Variimorphobacter saccharofermentans TaxID=2755051 RepID=A0A839JZ53_9FIRM|nr:Ig-like domain-containing protein [Variimorphobacter saccharofermentans]MBB2182955.1 Ig-like domain-containing protein [Variimorphobacter saccharofermentans]